MPIRVYYEVLNQKGTPALYSDNYANRPAAGYQGRIFYSPDTAQIFYDTGSTWTLLADAGVGSGSLASVCANGNTTATGITITGGGLNTDALTIASITQGSIVFAGIGGAFTQSNATFFWDNTNKRLGIGTNTPGVTLDIHGTGGTLIQLNGTGANNSYLQFQNAGVGKWRVGNQYSGGINNFSIYNNTLAANVMTIDSSSNTSFVGYVASSYYIASNGIQLAINSLLLQSGYTALGGSTNGLYIGLSSGVTQQFILPTGASYNYTYPAVSGTIAVWSSATNGTLPKFGTNNLVNSMLSDDGTSVTSAGATRSNLYIKAANNTYYGQLAFTNGTNGSYGGLSYNNSGQYMQFETASSEWMRLLSTGELGINTTSPDFPLTVKSNASANAFKILSRASGDSSISWYDSTNTTQYAHIDVGSTYFQIYASNSQPIQFYAGGSERMRLTSAGNLGIGLTPGSTIKLNIRGADQTNGTYSLYIDNAVNDMFIVRNDGVIFTGNATRSPYNDTSGAAANLIVTSGGNLQRSTSSLKYKKDILDYDKGLDIIKQIRPVYYKGKNDGNIQYAGFIAEEINDLGLTEFVQYANDGTPDALAYANMTALLTKGIQQLDDRLTALEQKLN